MAKYDNSKFYWLQLKEDFFEEDAINWLEEQPNGKEYCLFYLKLCLKSLKTNGVMIRKVGEMLVPYDCKKLAEITNTEVDTVVVAMQLLKQIGLIKMLENGQLYITELEKMIGYQSIGAFKKQQQRLISGQKEDKCPPEIDIEIDKDIDKKKELKKEKEIVDIYKTSTDHLQSTFNSLNNSKEIEEKKDVANATKCYQELAKKVIDYLNEKVGTRFGCIDSNTKEIKARFAENYKLEDFKTVIDKKCEEWLGTEQQRYLRPETLFCKKHFDGYLNGLSFKSQKPKLVRKEATDEEKEDYLRVIREREEMFKI